MPSEPDSSPVSSHQRADDFKSEVERPPSPSAESTQIPAMGPHLIISENDGNGEGSLTNDTVALLSLFPRENKVGDFDYRPFVQAITTPTAESATLNDLRGQLRQTEFATQQPVEQARAFKTELDQLRDVVAGLAGEHRRIEDAIRAAEERRAAATDSELPTLNDLREQLQQAELAIQQPVEQARAFKTELDQLRHVAAGLAGEYRRIEDAVRAAEERRVEQATAFKTELHQLQEMALRLAGEHIRIEDATRLAEQRSAAAVKSEAAALDDLRGQFQQAQIAISQSIDQTAAFRAELDQLRDVALQLRGERSQIEDATRAAGERSAAAVKMIGAIEARVGPLAVLQDAITSTEARLAALNDLAEQKAHHVAKLVSAMDARFPQLDKENQLIERSREMGGRLEQIASATTSQLAHAMNVKKVLESDLTRLEKRVQMLLESARSRVAEPAVGKVRFGSAGRTQKAQLIRYRREVIGGLSVLVLGSLTVLFLRSDPIRIESVPPNVQPILAASTVISSEMMLRTAVPTLPHMTPSRIQPMTQTVATAVAQPTPAPTPKPLPPAQSRQFTGTLEIQSNPAGAAVFINRENVGQTPLQLPQVRAGSHVIWMELAGFQRWTTAARVIADAVTRVDAKLEADPVPRGIP